MGTKELNSAKSQPSWDEVSLNVPLSNHPLGVCIDY